MITILIALLMYLINNKAVNNNIVIFPQNSHNYDNEDYESSNEIISNVNTVVWPEVINAVHSLEEPNVIVGTFSFCKQTFIK